ncbi:MAG: O-methyltransferase [Chloroflexi bacterium]|nr:MAG: O-methyltransferase [Chloroflexota bacterium]
MSDIRSELELLQQQEKTRKKIEEAITGVFAPEDEALRYALTSMREAGLPEIQISPIQGKFLQLLAAASNARSILEIGSLGGYSGIWLARALPPGGRLITLEINPTHAAVVRKSFEKAGVSDRTEVRVGNALDLLPKLESEAPFDLVFIDADKAPYPQYLEWALRLSRPGSIIVADNCIRRGIAFQTPGDEGVAGIVEFNIRAWCRCFYRWMMTIPMASPWRW